MKIDQKIDAVLYKKIDQSDQGSEKDRADNNCCRLFRDVLTGRPDDLSEFCLQAFDPLSFLRSF